MSNNIASGLQASGISMAFNVVLALFKISVGVAGNSYALIADGIESFTDVISSLVVYGGLLISSRPADACHPYGHGKAESLAALVVACFLLGAGGFIAYQSIVEIRADASPAPAWYTLLALLVVVVVKEGMFRFLHRTGDDLNSSALKGDAWHHRSDAITSLAAAIGISIALIGGKGYETADEWAALIACVIIFFNGIRLMRPALDEIMDASVPAPLASEIVSLAMAVEGVVDVEKCRVRKSGLGLIMDIDIEVDGDITVRRGHDIAHAVKDAIGRQYPGNVDITVHVEPATNGFCSVCKS